MNIDIDRWRRIGAIFDRVVELAPGERPQLLGELCGADIALRIEVDALLEADLRAETFEAGVDASRGAAAAELTQSSEPALAAGDRVGPWRLVSELGTGGMGVVWLAERADGQFEQRAAIKMVHGGHKDQEVLRRFLRERQILARLEHPHIARLIDGGLAADGRPYFAMEFVDGRPLLEHGIRNQLGVQQRLEMFVDVCAAVQTAHNQLVIHGDIKPSNVLVTASGAAKLLDFGIARLLGSDQRAQNGLALTVDYAPPEQRRGDEIGTAADVYALGVVLHELVHGRRPAPESRDGRAAGAFGARRWRDLDWIIARCLAERPQDRYAAVQTLADDVVRLVAGKPVSAHPDSTAYRLRRFAGRHRAGMVATFAGIVAVLLALGFALWQAREKTREATVARDVTDFVVGLFRAVDPESADGPAISAQDLLDRGNARLRDDTTFDRSVRSSLLLTLSRTYQGLGLYDRALPLAQQSLALRRSSPAAATLPVAESLQTLGTLYRLKADFAQSEPLLRDALRLRRALLADADPMVIESVDELANLQRARGEFAQADRLYEEAVRSAERTFGRDAVETARYLDNYAANLDDLGRHGEAGDGYRRALDIREAHLGPEHADVATSLLNLGNHLDESEDYAGAVPLLERALAIRRRVFGPTHPLVAGAELGLASVYSDQKRLEEAERSAQEAMRIFRSYLPETHPRISETLNMLALIRIGRRDFAGAADVLRDVLARERRTLGDDHPDTLAVANNLAYALGHVGAFAEAEGLQREVLARLRSDNGQGTVAFTYQNLAGTLIARGKVDEAVYFERLALAVRKKEDGDASLYVAVALRSLGLAEAQAGVAPEAERDLRAALAMGRLKAPDSAYAFEIALADLLVGRGRCEEAAPILTDAQQQLRAATRPDPALLPESELLLSACTPAGGDTRRAEALAQLNAMPGIGIDLTPTAQRLAQAVTSNASRSAADRPSVPRTHH